MESKLNSMQMEFHRRLRLFMKSDSPNAEEILHTYREMKEIKNRISIKTKEIRVKIPYKFDYSRLATKSSAYKIIKLIKERASNLPNCIKSFMIQGSFATEDFIPGWSDLDTLVVLNDFIFTSKDTLLEAREELRKLSLLCYSIDPLTHHLFIFVTEFDISYYPQAMMPLVVYENAMHLVGADEIIFNVRDDQNEKYEILTKFRNHFQKKIDARDFSKDVSNWKNDLAIGMMIPSLVLQGEGIYLYKKYSCDEAKKRFKDIDFSAIDEATLIRYKWSVPNLVKVIPLQLLLALPYFLSSRIVSLVRKFSTRKKPIEKPEVVSNLTKSFFELYAYIENKYAQNT